MTISICIPIYIIYHLFTADNNKIAGFLLLVGFVLTIAVLEGIITLLAAKFYMTKLSWTAKLMPEQGARMFQKVFKDLVLNSDPFQRLKICWDIIIFNEDTQNYCRVLNDKYRSEYNITQNIK